MDPIDQFSSAHSSTATSAKGFSTLTSEDFAKIIFSELKHQDPLAPNDTNALLEQVSTLRNIQANADLSDQLTSLVQQNQFSSATGLLGRTVGGITQDNQRTQGLVIGVSRTSQGPVVTLADGSRINMRSLDEVNVDPEPASPG